MQIAKRMYRKVKRKYDKDHNSIDRRQNYIIEKKKYRKVIYRAKKVAQELKLNRLADLENSDPKRFWADVNRILPPQEDSMSHIEPLNGWTTSRLFFALRWPIIEIPNLKSMLMRRFLH